jgi:hypothetical protein
MPRMKRLLAGVVVCWLTAVAGPHLQAQSPGSPALPGDTAQQPAAPAPRLQFGGEALAATAYVWRGFLESDERGLQPNAWMSLGPALFDVWANVEVTGDGLHVAEYDLSLFYTREVGRTNVAAGLTNYFFDKEGEEGGYERHSELAVMVTSDFFLSPSFEAYYSVSAERGAYASAALSYPHRLAANVVASIEGALGYNHRMWVEKSGFSDMRGTVKLSFERPAHGLQFDVALDYNHGLMKDETIGNKVVFSVGISRQ